jgi:hypothetical protein
MLKKARLLTHPTQAATSPARPEFAKTASSPKDAPYPKQGRSKFRGEEVHSALCTTPFAFYIVLGERINALIAPISEISILTLSL